MRIALVTPGGADETGIDRVIPAFLWLVERLTRRHDVHVFALAQEPQPRDWNLLGARVHNIGTDVGHVNEWASDAAVAVPVGDPRALADATGALLDDEPRRMRLAHAAQARAVAIDADFTASSFERIYADIVSAPRR